MVTQGAPHLENIVLMTVVATSFQAELPNGLIDRDIDDRSGELRINPSGHVIDCHRLFDPFLEYWTERPGSGQIDCLRVSLCAFGFVAFAASFKAGHSVADCEGSFRSTVNKSVAALESDPPEAATHRSDFTFGVGEVPWFHQVDCLIDPSQDPKLTVGVGRSKATIDEYDLESNDSFLSRSIDTLALGLALWSQQDAVDSESFLRMARSDSEGSTTNSLAEERSWIETVSTVPLAVKSLAENLPVDLQETWIDSMDKWRIRELSSTATEKLELYRTSIERRQEVLDANRQKRASILLAVIGASTLGAFIELLVTQADQQNSLDFSDTSPTRWILISLIIALVIYGAFQIHSKGENDS